MSRCRILRRARAELRENPFKPCFGLGTGHLQTVVGSQQRRRFPWGWKECNEEVLELENHSRVRIKLLIRDASRPTLIAVHGMAGSSDSCYMLALSHKAFREGWNFILPSLYNVEVNPDRPKIFHAGSSDRLAEIIDICTHRHRLRTLLLVGISMGGNILLKLLGEWGGRCLQSVRAAAAISPLVDLTSSWSVLDKPSNSLYRWYYLRRLRRLSMQRAEMMSRFIDLEKMRKVKTIREFDELLTAPLSGFDGAFHYYREASSLGWIPRITTPTLLLHAKDDPLLPWELLTGREVSDNHCLLLHLTEAGGHVAFIARRGRRDIDRSWAENRVIDFLRIALSEPEESQLRAVPHLQS